MLRVSGCATMAKQRPHPQLKARNRTPAPRTRPRRDSGAAAAGGRRSATPAQPANGEVRRSTYFDALAVYEKGVEALQRHQYGQALQILQSFLQRYPEEKELHERVRLYLNVCERHAAPRAASPLNVDERLYASTLALNGGRYDEAISHLRLVRDEAPDNDYALYMLAVAHAQRGEHAEATAHLNWSIDLNPENRARARRDPDLEPLRAAGAQHAGSDTAPGRDAEGHLNRRPRPGRV